VLANSATLLSATGFAVGATAWSGYTPAIAFSLLVLILLVLPRRRRDVFLLMLCYYAGATWQIIPGASVFFGHHANPIQILFLWLGASSILAAPWAALWSHRPRLRLCGVLITLVLLAVPPLGIIGCASPLTAAGILFPGLAWAGLVLTLLLCGFLAAYPRRAIVLTLAVALPAHVSYRPAKSPADWQAVSTHFGGVGLDTPDPLAEYAAAQLIQNTALNSSARVIVFPETVVSNWNEATDAFWDRTIQMLRRDGKTLLVGANVSEPNGRRYFNAIVVRGATANGEFLQRIPIPIAMWTPYGEDGVPLRLAGAGTLDIAGSKAAVLICYEHLLVWPVMTSFTRRPTVLLGIANVYWARATTVPNIQRACLTSWARLFHVPLLWAENT
jgi:apolipoprotein N-acyltransferase